MFRINFTALIAFSMISNFIYSQGCSDAGLCTVNSFQPNDNDTIKSCKNQLKFGASTGRAANSIITIGGFIEYNRIINGKSSFDFKLTSLLQKDNNICVFGMSDLMVNFNYEIDQQLTFTVGAKAPMNSANRTYKGLPLPMDYQSSLGTYDLIIGTSYKLKILQFILAFQQPIIQNNNQYLVSNVDDNYILKKFTVSTNNFIRSGDVLFRVSSLFKLNPKWRFIPSFLPIYHLSNDKYYDENEKLQEIEGSKGLTLNGNLYVEYIINSKSSIQIIVGKPFIYRKSRPDGLTRSLIANIEYQIKF